MPRGWILAPFSYRSDSTVYSDSRRASRRAHRPHLGQMLRLKFARVEVSCVITKLPARHSWHTIIGKDLWSST